MTSCCPLCGSMELHPVRATGLAEKWKGLFGLFLLRCRGCGTTISEDFASIAYAHCPKCFRHELAGWQEEYLPPKIRQRLLLLLGAGKQRCEVCRLNFVSFRRRRRQWMPYELRARRDRMGQHDKSNSA